MSYLYIRLQTRRADLTQILDWEWERYIAYLRKIQMNLKRYCGKCAPTHRFISVCLVKWPSFHHFCVFVERITER